MSSRYNRYAAGIIECIWGKRRGGEGKKKGREGKGKESERGRSPILPWILMVQDIAFASIYPRISGISYY